MGCEIIRRGSGALCLVLASATLSACVTSGTHEKLKAAFASSQEAAREREDAQQAEIEALEGQLAKANVERFELETKIDNASALIGQLENRLVTAGQNAKQLSSEKGELASGLAEARARLEELRKQKAAAENGLPSSAG